MKFIYPDSVIVENTTNITMELSIEQLGFIQFCIGQYADDKRMAPFNRRYAMDMYAEMQKARENAEIR